MSPDLLKQYFVEFKIFIQLWSPYFLCLKRKLSYEYDSLSFFPYLSAGTCSNCTIKKPNLKHICTTLKENQTNTTKDYLGANLKLPEANFQWFMISQRCPHHNLLLKKINIQELLYIYPTSSYMKKIKFKKR